MVDFDQLPQKTRSLLLATLALEISSNNCRSIFDLAARTKQSVQDVWRDVCRKTSQPRCTMPRLVLESQYTAGATAEAPSGTPAATQAAGPTVVGAVPSPAS